MGHKITSSGFGNSPSGIKKTPVEPSVAPCIADIDINCKRCKVNRGVKVWEQGCSLP